MKKFLCILLTISILFCLVSCKQGDTKKDNSDNFQIKTASNVVDTYMKYLTNGDVQNCKSLATKSLAATMKDTDGSNLKIKGYEVIESNEVGKSGIFKLKVARTDVTRAAATLDEVTIKVVTEDNEYKISEINVTTDKEAFQEGSSLRVKSKDNVKTYLMLDMEGIPQYTFAKDDKANLFKLTVPKDKLTTAIFGYEGSNLAVSTMNKKDSFVGIAKIDESLMVIGGGSDSSDTPSADKGGGSTQSSPKEKPVSKEFVALDYLKNTTIDFTTFSMGENFLLVQFTRENIGKCMRIYRTDNGELIPYKFDEKFATDKLDIVFSSFDKNAVNFDVLPRPNTDKEAAKDLGKWQLDLKEFKAKKM